VLVGCECLSGGWLIRGNLEVLKWLRENGCPWNYETWYAARSGGQDLLRWVEENGGGQFLSKDTKCVHCSVT